LSVPGRWSCLHAERAAGGITGFPSRSDGTFGSMVVRRLGGEGFLDDARRGITLGRALRVRARAAESTRIDALWGISGIVQSASTGHAAPERPRPSASEPAAWTRPSASDPASLAPAARFRAGSLDPAERFRSRQPAPAEHLRAGGEVGVRTSAGGSARWRRWAPGHRTGRAICDARRGIDPGWIRDLAERVIGVGGRDAPTGINARTPPAALRSTGPTRGPRTGREPSPAVGGPGPGAATRTAGRSRLS
jgi:hypothetical protein